MTQRQITRIATAIVVFTGTLWGFYWLPVRGLETSGLPGPWGTVAITLAAVLVLSPLALRQREALRQADPVALGAILLGGAAFALYSVGFVYGRVALIILLYFLTPVWSTLIGRFVMGWHTPRLRVVAILVGLLGLGVMLSAEGDLPLPRGLGEWMALIAGLMWSFATTGMRSRAELPPLVAAFVFAIGAALVALGTALWLEPWRGLSGAWAPTLGLALVTGALWWGASIASLMWATVRLEPARVGILLMSEVIVGAGSAALLAGEHLHPLEIAGGALVILAGALEVWPTGARHGASEEV